MQKAEIYEKNVIIPTYKCGAFNKNPMFLEKRVYQGSSGKVYPYPVIDKISDVKEDVEYDAVFMENEYLLVMFLPCFGGRIQRALDKTNNYDFVYYNEVIKPALVGLTGPWISGGIEFNWPQHHRPTTYLPVDYRLETLDDGSVRLRTNDLDEMYGTKGETIFTLYPDKAYIEIKGQLYNRTPFDQTFLWWANPAVAVNEDTQSVFPPDVHAVFDHGKRAVSQFPIAYGTYYKHDYSEGVDISRYKNIPVPTSYMAHKSNFDFVGGYDYSQRAGIMHIADHHISPGKKQWTWGNGDFGQAWDINLTDNNGPYIELMTGVYTDNQPDFTWLKAFEEKTFTQYFMPYKGCGYAKNASTKLVLNFEEVKEGVKLMVYPTSCYEKVTIKLTQGTKEVFRTKCDITPYSAWTTTVEGTFNISSLALSVFDEKGTLMLSCKEEEESLSPLPSPAPQAKEPNQILTNEELILTAEHLEQYRHATFDSLPYYQEALKRDRYDVRANNGYGLNLLRRGLFQEAKACFQKAIDRLSQFTLNPFEGRSYYNLGLALAYEGEYDKAYDSFYKATWSYEEAQKSFYALAVLSLRKEELEPALYFVNRAIVYNAHNIKACALKAYLLKRLGQDYIAQVEENLSYDPFDYLSLLLINKEETIKTLAHNRIATYLYTASDLIAYKCYNEALILLNLLENSNPMVAYYKAYVYSQLGKEDAKVQESNLDCCFPNTLEDLKILEYAVNKNSEDKVALYLLGNLYYDKKRYEEAYNVWKKSAELKLEYSVLYRNLSIVSYNKRGEKVEAVAYLLKAMELDKEDARLVFELLQLYEKLKKSISFRLNFLEERKELLLKRDDLLISYISLLNLSGREAEALSLLNSHHFHPWEGGEGKVTKEYMLSLKLLARTKMKNKEWEDALSLLSKALVFPHNLGEGKLEGSKDNDIHYLMGICYRAKGEENEALQEFYLATLGAEEIANALYYYDQSADMSFFQALALFALKDEKKAKAKCYKLIDYGKIHLFDDVKLDYFAVSLPDLQLWDEDLNTINQAHCYYVIALGYLALSNKEKATFYFDLCLSVNSTHKEAYIYSTWDLFF